MPGELEYRLLAEECDRRGVRSTLRAHGDQHAAQQLDRFVDEPAQIDEAIIPAPRQQPDPLRLDERGIEGGDHHGVKDSISRAALSQSRTSQTARDRNIGSPNRPMLGQVSEAPVASRSGSQREAQNRSSTVSATAGTCTGRCLSLQWKLDRRSVPSTIRIGVHEYRSRREIPDPGLWGTSLRLDLGLD